MLKKMSKYLGKKVVPNKSWFTVYELYNYTSPDFIHSSFNVNSSNYVQKLSNSYKFAYQIQVFHIFLQHKQFTDFTFQCVLAR